MTLIFSKASPQGCNDDTDQGGSQADAGAECEAIYPERALSVQQKGQPESIFALDLREDRQPALAFVSELLSSQVDVTILLHNSNFCVNFF